MQCSDEQRAVIAAISQCNVIVDACAGSGKTTTVLGIAKIHQVPILLLTYNSRLRAETMERAADLPLLTVHTYHSFGYCHISKKCRTDAGIISFLARGGKLTLAAVSTFSDDVTNSDANVLTPVPQYSIIIVDETQDMNVHYCELVQKIIDLMPRARICVMGDKFQSIYDFNGADSRFITLADKIYPSGNWSRLNLSTSYRLTRQMAALINNCMRRGCESTVGVGIVSINSVGSESTVGSGCVSTIAAVRDGPLPVYTHYSSPRAIIDDIKSLFREGFMPGDIFILAPSVRSKHAGNPIKKLANSLSANKILVYVPTSDDSKVPDDVIRGKLVFSSFHQAKGLERKVVMVVGFDDSYNEFYSKSDPTVCSNALYVAITRARERLYLYHGRGRGYLRCVDVESLDTHVRMVGTPHVNVRVRSTPPLIVGVTKLLAHIRSDVLAHCFGLLRVQVIRPAGPIIPLAGVTLQVGAGPYHEEVSDINGIAVPMYYEARSRVLPPGTGKVNIGLDGVATIQLFGRADVAEALSKLTYLREITTAMKAGATVPGYTMDAVLRLACPLVLHSDDLCGLALGPRVLELSKVYDAIRSGLSVRAHQIRTHDWVPDELFEAASARLAGVMCVPYILESRVEFTVSDVKVVGYADYVDASRLIEIKCTSELKPEHYLQCAIYSRAYNLQNLIFNVTTGELSEIIVSWEHVDEILRLLVCTKYHTSGPLTDEEFLRAVRGEHVGVKMCAGCMPRV
jgi:AAA domain/UvrD-like helicase C-terminal domain